jgi:type VI secretion system protein ImpH
MRQRPWEFDFFQAVRLLALSRLPGRYQDERGDDGHSALRHVFEEQVRFRAHIGHGFPSNTVAALSMPDGPGSDADRPSVPEMTVSFMGLAGTAGILPAHYTQLLIDRAKEKDFSLREFLDLFNHRLIAQFWRAWAKTRFHIGFEAARRHRPPREDLFTTSLYSLVGMATGGLRERQSFPDDCLLYYSGHFAHFPRSAVALRQLVGDWLGVPVAIRQFQGQWMQLQPADLTRLGAARGGPANNRLGESTIAGERIWGIENRFRVRLGTLGYRSFCHFLPDRPGFRELGQLVRTYAGAAWDFDVQLVLHRREVPPCQLSREGGVQLGWNTWLFSGTVDRDPDDAVFECDGMPDR